LDEDDIFDTVTLTRPDDVTLRSFGRMRPTDWTIHEPKDEPTHSPMHTSRLNMTSSTIQSELPLSFDWRDRGAVGDVRNQGSAGKFFLSNNVNTK